MAKEHRCLVDATLDGERLDKALAALVPGLSRRKAREVIAIGGVFIDNQRVKVASRKVRQGQKLKVTVGSALIMAGSHKFEKLQEKLAIVADEKDFVVVNKPAGLHTVPTPESDQTNLQALLEKRFGKVWTVHRLDMATSGLLVFAKTKEAEQVLSAQFRDHSIGRRYEAVVAGAFDREVTEESKIEGRDAKTHFESLGVLPFGSRISATLFTGRTHQIRIHCQRLGHPVLGDDLYGGPKWPGKRLALHAVFLEFGMPGSAKPLEFNCRWPEEIESIFVSAT